MARAQVFLGIHISMDMALPSDLCSYPEELEGLLTLSANRHISRKPRQKMTSKQTCVTFAEQVSMTGRWKWSTSACQHEQKLWRENVFHIFSAIAGLVLKINLVASGGEVADWNQLNTPHLTR